MTFFKKTAENEFQIKPIVSQDMDNFIQRCENIYKGKPYWVDKDDHIKTVNFAKAICSETARLATLDIGVNLTENARAVYLQSQIDELLPSMRVWMEYASAYGTMILKPNGDTVQAFFPNRFVVTDTKNGKIRGCIFIDQDASANGKDFYTRFEWHRFEKQTDEAGNELEDSAEVYRITNICYRSESRDSVGYRIDINQSPWAGLEPDVVANDITDPLFGVFRTPNANNISPDDPLGAPIFADAIEELKDLDIAYSRNAKEILDSQKIVLLDSDRLIPSGNRIDNTTTGFESMKKRMKLPDYVRNVFGNGRDEFYQEINPSLNTQTRLVGINALLSQIGYKCGFSNGYFVFNERQGLQTATQTEAEQQRTIQYIKDVRDQLKSCMEATIYAMDRFADAMGVASGTVEIVFDFGDLTYNEEEDRARWLSYANTGKVPFWYYLVKFEGMTEQEAKEITETAKAEAMSMMDPMSFGRDEE